MGVVITRRQRLTSSVIAVLAIATTAAWFSEADAQRNRPPPPALECPRGTVPTGRTFSETTPNIQLALQTLARDNATAQDLALARDSCAGNLTDRNRRHNIEAYACVANAQTRLANLDRTEANYRQAYCANQAVAGIAGNNASAADANQRRGDILMSLRDISGSGSELGARYLSQAIEDYRAAVRSPNASRHFALGRAYMAQNNPTAANEQIRLGAAAQPNGVDETRAAVRAIVQLAGASPAPNDATSLLRRAVQLDSTSASANAALGLNVWPSNEAAGLFRAALTARNDSADHPGRNYLAEANYHLALLDMRPGAYGNALTLGQAALSAGGSSDPKYGRLVCLAYIARGWTPQTAESTACATDRTSPQGELLNMMYLLRQAQYLNFRDAQGRDVILLRTPQREQHQLLMTEIIRSYDRANVGIAGWTDQQRRDALNDWPGASNIPADRRDIRQMLEFGRWILAQECPGGVRLPDYLADTPGSVRSNGRDFYRQYNVSGCRAT